MRSWREPVIAIAAAWAVATAAIGCGKSLSNSQHGNDGGGSGSSVTPCDQSYLTYDNFGEPFVSNWCRGCHSVAIPMTPDPDMRQGAPPMVNFDTHDDVVNFKDMIVAHATGDMTMVTKPMPPAGGPSDDERAMLAEWLGCGAK
jgi:uncharacterized membrane protein